MKNLINKFFRCNFFYIVVFWIFNIISFFLDTYVLGYVMKQIEAGFDLNQLIRIIIIVGLIMCISKVAYNMLSSKVSFLSFESRMNYLFDINSKAINNRYRSFEYEKFVSSYQRTLSFFSSDIEGYQEAINGFIEIVPFFILTVFSGFFIGRYSILILLISIIIAILVFPIKDKINSFDLLEDEDLGDIENRKDYYHSLTTNSKYSKDIRVFHLKDMILKRYRDVIDDLFDIFDRKSKLNLKVKLHISLLLILNDISILAILLLRHKNILVSDFVIILNMYYLFSESIMKVLESYSSIKKNSNLFERYDQVLNKNLQVFNELDITNKFKVDFINVSYKYPGSSDLALENLSVSFTSDEKIAIIGENGAGKTTFIKLLIGLLEPTSGQILFDGKNISADDRINYFSSTFQTSKLLPGSVADNLFFNNKQNRDIEFIKSYIHKNKIENKSKFRDLDLEDHIGNEFFDDAFIPSGGQEQLMVTLRALLSNKRMLIFDEPTSNLDIDKEIKFYNILSEFEDRGYIIISHRISITNVVDRIIVIRDKKVENSGTYHYLKENSPYFKHLLDISEELMKGAIDD